jgi:hypothetical protein
MENNIDKILSDAFQGKVLLENENDFTAKLMRKLPHQGVSTKTRIGILVLCTVVAAVIPLFNGGYEDFYTWGEEIMEDGFFAFQYWMDQLSWLA